MKRLFLSLVATLALILPSGAAAWTDSGYRGHGWGYHTRGGVVHAQTWQHSHSTGACASGHQHHYALWKEMPGGYYVRVGDHDHHFCAPKH